MARKPKRARKAPAAPPPRGTSDRDKAVDALMALLAEHPFEQIGLAEVAGRAGLKLSAAARRVRLDARHLSPPTSRTSTARCSPAATPTWPRSRRASGCSTC